MAWLGQLKIDGSLTERDADRRQLRLHVDAIAGDNAARVQVHNISTTGLLVECDAQTLLPDTFEVELPEQGMTMARIVWRSDNFYGCEFENPVTSRVISAAQLRSAPETRRETTAVPAAVAAPQVIAPSLDRRSSEDEYSPRTKLAIIVGSAASLWAIILFGAAWIV